MTHNYPQDQVLLPQILARKPRYLGMLGPRRRTERLFEEIGADLAAHDVHAPVGLDLGGDHPEGIALSIISEIQAVLAERAGGSLRERSGPIHGPVRECGLLPRPEWSGPDEQTLLPACEISGAAGRG
jgi:xanthine/CO dehydrogenase XdhC/CoxF family maturation factor